MSVAPLPSSEVVTYPGARSPERTRTVVSHGIGLAVHEWGDPTAPALLLAHGGFDFGRTFDVFAPLLAAGGWRVVVWDQRGHGDSQHAQLYSWDADVRDAVAVLDSIGPGPVPILGHSKGGAVLAQLAAALPHRVARLVNIDGLPGAGTPPDIHDDERIRMLAGELADRLDHRRGTADRRRKPGTIDELARRRGRINPRLSHDWLRYLVSVGARRDPDGWRWKIDPVMRPGGFGPWRPGWAMARLPGLSMPLLAVIGLQPETMGWVTHPDDVAPHLPPGARFEVLEESGHFIHIEEPQRVAEMVLDFLGDPADAPHAAVPAADTAAPRPRPRRADPSGPHGPHGLTNPASAVAGATGPAVTLRHNRVDLALHRLREAPAAGGGRPLLHLHGLGERAPDRVPPSLDAWPGSVWALELTGHGASAVPVGGGYTSELLMGDADMALAELGPVTLHGRGLGGYVALLVAGARPDLVQGAVVDDGPGLTGGSNEPGTSFVLTQPLRVDGPPDPYALLELSLDLRPPEYAATFARQAATLSGLEVAIAVAARVRPAWLAAVAQEPGVRPLPVAEALDLFATR